MPSFWLFNIGTGDMMPPPDWFIQWDHHRWEMWFPPNKRPIGVNAGDFAIINGSLRAGLLAVVRIVSTEPEKQATGDEYAQRRWPWKLRYDLLYAVRADGNTASLEAASIKPTRVQRQPHIKLTREEYDGAVGAMVDAARVALAA